MSKDEANIPTARLMEWYNEQADEFKKASDRLKEISDSAGDDLPDDDPNFTYMLGEIQGRRSTLNALVAFMITETAGGIDSIEIDALLSDG